MFCDPSWTDDVSMGVGITKQLFPSRPVIKRLMLNTCIEANSQQHQSFTKHYITAVMISIHHTVASVG